LLYSLSLLLLLLLFGSIFLVSLMNYCLFVRPSAPFEVNGTFNANTRKNQAYQNGQKQVMIFFHVSDSRHIQGAALLTSMATYQEAAAQAAAVSSDNKEEEAFSYRIKVEWYRTTEMPVHMAVEAAPHLLLPTQQTQYCQDMSPQTGESIMKLLWNAPLTTLYESWSGEQDPPANDAILSDFRAPIALRQEEHGKDLCQLEATEACWPIVPGPGFIFGCSSDTMDECLGRGLFGLPAHMKMDAANCIVPGSTIFLFNVTDRLLFGIFEALTPAIMNIEPTAFSKNPKATTSPFPVQVRVRVALECPRKSSDCHC
jgi:cleavage and polyadenylation specificity factor subunit 4